MIDVVFVHGWAFDGRLWSRIIPLLNGINPHIVELGFTGTPDKSINNLPKNAVLVGHSFGIMWLLKNLPPSPRCLISIGGFDCFYKHIPVTEIRAMKIMARRDPETLLQRFRAEAGAKDFYNNDVSYNSELLLQGLKSLENDNHEGKLRSLPCPAIALASKDDKIVPSTMSQDIWGDHELHWAHDGGHALPLSRAEWCAQIIQEQIDAYSLPPRR